LRLVTRGKRRCVCIKLYVLGYLCLLYPRALGYRQITIPSFFLLWNAPVRSPLSIIKGQGAEIRGGPRRGELLFKGGCAGSVAYVLHAALPCAESQQRETERKDERQRTVVFFTLLYSYFILSAFAAPSYLFYSQLGYMSSDNIHGAR
jgi:hypothetical protein